MGSQRYIWKAQAKVYWKRVSLPQKLGLLLNPARTQTFTPRIVTPAIITAGGGGGVIRSSVE